MADCYINVFMNDEQKKQIEELGLGDQIKEIEGKYAVQVEMSKKDQKKLLKGYLTKPIDMNKLSTYLSHLLQ